MTASEYVYIEQLQQRIYNLIFAIDDLILAEMEERIMKKVKEIDKGKE